MRNVGDPAHHDGAAMPIDAWFSLADPEHSSRGRLADREIDAKKASENAEQIVVYGQRSKRDLEWRMELIAKQPTYEASNSDAAQPLIPYAAYTSPDQQRMMSEKTDSLGQCGALGGYVQCPNLPP